MASPPDLVTPPDLATKPAPTISNVAPNGATTAGGGMLTITGTGFQMGATVTVGGTACSNPTVTDTTITCTIPAKAMGCGTAAIVVTNPDMQSVTDGMGFSYRTAMVSYAAAVNTMNTGANPRRVVAADLNGDMKLDLVTANQGANNNVSVFLNNGTGGFPMMPTNLTTAGASTVADVAVADFNGDNKLDIVSVNNATTNITLYLGMGNGTFGTGSNFTAGATPGAIAVADLNNDNKPDVVVGSTGTGTLNVLLANAAGTGFMAPTLITVAGSTSIGDVELADLDGDNKRDLIFTSRNQGNVTVYQGMGGTSFMSPGTFAVGMNPFGVFVTDINGDSKPDVVAANTNSNNVSILIGNGNRTFAAAANFGTANGPESVRVADMNKDGVMDILTANPATSNFSYLQGMGNNMYAGVANRATGTGPASLAVADFNGDTLPDVAVGHNNMNNVGVSLQQCQ